MRRTPRFNLSNLAAMLAILALVTQGTGVSFGAFQKIDPCDPTIRTCDYSGGGCYGCLHIIRNTPQGPCDYWVCGTLKSAGQGWNECTAGPEGCSAGGGSCFTYST